MRTPCLLLLALALALPAAAQRPFTLSGGLGGEYQRQSFDLGLGGGTQETTRLTGRAYLRFSSAFWSPDLLRYSFLVSADRTKQDYGGSRDTMNTLGYGISLHFFPAYRDQFQLTVGRNTLDLTREASAGYTRTSDYAYLRGILHGWSLDLKRTDSRLDGGSTPDPRTDESGSLTKTWALGAGSLSFEARHYRLLQDFFGTENLQQSVLLHTSQNFSPGHSLWMDLVYRKNRYSDSLLGYETSNDYGNFAGQWRKELGARWETQVYVTGLFASGQEGADTQWLNRLLLTSPLSVDLTLGYFTATSDSVRRQYPYYGAGLHFLQGWNAWRVNLEGGYTVYQGSAIEGTPDTRTPYGLASLTREGETVEFTLTGQYNGNKANVRTEVPGTGGIFDEATASLTLDNYLGQFDLRWHPWYAGTVRLQSYYNSYREDAPWGGRKVSGLTNRLDGLWPHGEVGITVFTQDLTAPAGRDTYDAWDAHAVYRLNTHLSLRGNYIERKKLHAGVQVDEREINAALDYIIGKFTLYLNFQSLQADSGANRSKSGNLFVGLMRRFGDE